MSLPFTKWGSFGKSKGIIDAYRKQSRAVNFGAVEKLTFNYDPFGNPVPTHAIRHAQNWLVDDKTRLTNPKTIVKTNILSDQSEPTIVANLIDGKSVKFKTQNLTLLEILTLFNQVVSEQAPKKEAVTVVETKAQKSNR